MNSFFGQSSVIRPEIGLITREMKPGKIFSQKFHVGAYSAAKLRAPEIELQKGANVGSEPLPLSCRLTDLINELHEMTSELFKLAASKSGSFPQHAFCSSWQPSQGRDGTIESQCSEVCRCS